MTPRTCILSGCQQPISVLTISRHTCPQHSPFPGLNSEEERVFTISGAIIFSKVTKRAKEIETGRDERISFDKDRPHRPTFIDKRLFKADRAWHRKRRKALRVLAEYRALRRKKPAVYPPLTPH